MTVCVGMVDSQGTVHIMGDSYSGYADMTYRDVRSDPKVFRVGPFLIGITSSWRMKDLLQYSWSPPAHPENMDADRYLRTLVVDSLRSLFRDGGYMSLRDSQERGGSFLLGYQGRLFTVQGDFSIGECRCGFDAVGCGWAYAVGALFALNEQGGLSPERQLDVAIRAAWGYSIGVMPPFVYEQLPREEATREA